MPNIFEWILMLAPLLAVAGLAIGYFRYRRRRRTRSAGGIREKLTRRDR